MRQQKLSSEQTIDQSKSKRLDLRTSQLIDVRGWRDLRGVYIDSAQPVTVAPQLAAALELNIKDQEDI
jgi:hypothetical protein